MDEDIKRVTEYKVNDVMYDPAIRLDFANVYTLAVGPLSCNTCPQILYQAYLKLKNTPNLIPMKAKKYITTGLVDTTMSADEKIPSGLFTTDNLTDEEGEKLFKAKIPGVIENPHYVEEKAAAKTEAKSDKK